jgi:hypothetical protein
MNTPIPPTIPSDSNLSSLRTSNNLVASNSITAKTAHIFAVQPGVNQPLGPAFTTFLFTSDVAGKIQFTSLNITGQQTGYTFLNNYNFNPIVIITPANEIAGRNMGSVYVESATNQFTINFATSDGGNLEYLYNYFVLSSIGST